MTPMNSYLVDAMIKWIIDNGCNPYVVVNANHPRAVVPTEFVKDGHITLNVSVSDVKNFFMDQEAISFNAGFNGRPVDVFIPMASIVRVYAAETGYGMMLPPIPEAFDNVDNATDTEKDNKETTKKERPSFLKVIK